MPRRLWIAVCFALLVAIPAILGFLLVEDSRKTALFGGRVNALNLKTPHKSPDHILEDLGQGANRADNLPIPRVYMTKLPDNLATLTIPRKKQLFTAIMIPLILKTNELILEDRAKLTVLRKKVEGGVTVSKLERQYITKLLKDYKLKAAPSLVQIPFDELIKRMDIIPPSLALAQAATESGWGTSRFAREGNALYGQWVWGDDAKGIVPEKRSEGATHKVKSFPYLLESVIGYARNLNTSFAYPEFRDLRADMRANNQPLGGVLLSQTLLKYSERGAVYLGELKVLIIRNKFYQYDFAILAPKWWSNPS
jgi:Bax protein